MIQKCLSDLEGEQKNDLLFKVTSKAHALSQDPSGYASFSCLSMLLILDYVVIYAESFTKAFKLLFMFHPKLLLVTSLQVSNLHMYVSYSIT